MMNKFLSIVCVLLFSNFCNAQIKTDTTILKDSARFNVIDYSKFDKDSLAIWLKDTSKLYVHVETESEFPDGWLGWRKFLETNLKVDALYDSLTNKEKRIIKKQGGRFTALVSFTVCKDGTLCDISVNQPDGNKGIINEALRVMSLSPKWKPGEQNGVKVKSKKTQPITFVVQ